jgi:hypothetical protein
MKKIVILFLCLTLLSAGCTCLIYNSLKSTAETTILVIDAVNKSGLPRNFRMTNDLIKAGPAKLPNLQGLSELMASGSSQFSEKELQGIKQKINYNYPITVVDLRQESHGFVNGMAVSWYGKNNEANIGLTKEEVLQDEQQKLAQLAQTKMITINYPRKSFKQPIRVVAPFTVQNEETLVQSIGLNYMRIPVTDHHRPDDIEVDRFIAFVKSLPKGTWLHFHCRAGIGRTTIFLEMYDMMFNAKQVEFKDIIERQVLLGGKNVINDYKKHNRNKNFIEKARFIQRFYIYCKTNRDNFNTSWTEWLKRSKVDSGVCQNQPPILIDP